MVPTPDFGEPPTPAEQAEYISACQLFMGGLMKAGEFAATRYFVQFSRTYGQRLSKLGNATHQVSVSGHDAWVGWGGVGWMGGWVDGWVGGWMGGVAG